MGLYQSELTRQIHLRNRQKREWEKMKQAELINREKKKNDLSRKQELFEKEQREEDLEEIRETEVSKSLAAAMFGSARESKDNTLMKVVDLLQNQNGTTLILIFL